MKVQELMVQEVRSCSAHDDLTAPARIMWEADCGSVPVVGEDGAVVGMLTDRDLCMAAYTTGRPLAQLRVADVMAREVRSCRPQDDLQEAEETMRSAQVRRLPVVDGGRLVGILSLNDLALAAADERRRRSRGATPQEVAGVLAAVCAPRAHAAAEPAPAIPLPQRAERTASKARER